VIITFNHHAQLNRNICYILVYTSTRAFLILLGYNLWLYYLALHYLLTRGCDHPIGRCRDNHDPRHNLGYVRGHRLSYTRRRRYYRANTRLNSLFLLRRIASCRVTARAPKISRYFYLLIAWLYSSPRALHTPTFRYIYLAIKTSATRLSRRRGRKFVVLDADYLAAPKSCPNFLYYRSKRGLLAGGVNG
jgi:hypothetical protein